VVDRSAFLRTSPHLLLLRLFLFLFFFLSIFLFPPPHPAPLVIDSVCQTLLFYDVNGIVEHTILT
jgi:hypothetical protein